MTELQWMAAHHPDFMVSHLRNFGDEAALRLFACACCARIWGMIPDERSRRAVEVAEQFARGQASRSELEIAHARAEKARDEAWHEEYVAEAEANFCYSGRYCTINARLYAACAAWQTVAPSMILLGNHPYFKDHGSHYWAAAAEKNLAIASVFESLGDATKGPVYDMALSAGEIALREERSNQAKLLRGLAKYAPESGGVPRGR